MKTIFSKEIERLGEKVETQEILNNPKIMKEINKTKERIKKGDFSEFIPIEKLKIKESNLKGKVHSTVSRKLRENYVELDRFLELEKKYSKLCNKQIRIENQLKMFEKLPQAVLNNNTKDGLYIKRIKSGSNVFNGIIYLENTKINKNCCDICGKRRITTAHHIIPKRLETINKELGQIRIRVCNECREKIHPENGIDKEYILRKNIRQLEKLQRRVNKNAEEMINPFKNNLLNREREIVESIPNIIEELRSRNPKKIYPSLQKIEGRLKELKYIRNEFSKLINNELGTKK